MTTPKIPTAWSFSSLDMWRQCPLKYKLTKIDKLDKEQSEAMIRGNRIHVALAKYIEGQGTLETLPVEVKDPYHQGLYRAMREFDGMKIVEKQWGFNSSWKETGWFAGDTWFRAILDVGLFYDDDTFEAVDHKGLAVITPIMTPTGFTTMGELEVGDWVFGSNGAAVSVIAKSEVKNIPCYRVTFDTGAYIVCDHEHLWDVRRRTAGSRHYREVVAVTALRKGDYIECAMPLQMSRDYYVIDPYVLGCWLGDGHKRDGMISKPDEDLFLQIAACGYDVLPIQSSSDMGRTIKGLRGQLGQLNLLNNKHIPPDYFVGSTEDRLALVRGLMDTDGTWNTTRGEAIFTNMDEELCRSLAKLVSSLGERATIMRAKHRGFGKEGYHWRVRWKPRWFNPFRLARKFIKVGELCRIDRNGYYVRSVEQVESVPTQCIAVDAEDHLYLAGESLIPTHNTGKRYGSNDEQVELFSAAVMSRFPKLKNVTTRLVYIDQPNGLEEIADHPAKDREKLVDKWTKAAQPMLGDRVWPARPNDKCTYCPFNKHKGGQCRFG